MPANTGAARANHRGACFAGSPAPTEGSAASVRWRQTAYSGGKGLAGAGQQPPSACADGGLKTDLFSRRLRNPCGSGRAREHGRSPCQPPRCLLRGLARSHRGICSVSQMAANRLFRRLGSGWSGSAATLGMCRWWVENRPVFQALAQSLWERACPRTRAQPVPTTAVPASRARPLPQGSASSVRWRQTAHPGKR